MSAAHQHDIGASSPPLQWRDAALQRLEILRGWIDGALEQLSDEEMRRAPAPGLNSAAITVMHLSGSMRSRFTDFLTSDGEKPWRHREREFIDDGRPREAIMAEWKSAWEVATGAIAALSEADMAHLVRIRSEVHTVPDAVMRFVAHVAYHAGQMLLIGRMLKGEAWRHQTIAPGGSEAFNRGMEARFGTSGTPPPGGQ